MEQKVIPLALVPLSPHHSHCPEGGPERVYREFTTLPVSLDDGSHFRPRKLSPWKVNSEYSGPDSKPKDAFGSRDHDNHFFVILVHKGFEPLLQRKLWSQASLTHGHRLGGLRPVPAASQFPKYTSKLEVQEARAFPGF